MSTKTKHTTKADTSTVTSPGHTGGATSPSCSYDASRIFLHEIYALRLRARAGAGS